MKHCIRAGIAACFVIAGAAPAWAQSAPSSNFQEVPFAQFKQQQLARLNEYIALLQQEAACDQAAADQEGLRTCATNRKKAVDALRRRSDGGK